MFYGVRERGPHAGLVMVSEENFPTQTFVQVLALILSLAMFSRARLYNI